MKNTLFFYFRHIFIFFLNKKICALILIFFSFLWIASCSGEKKEDAGKKNATESIESVESTENTENTATDQSTSNEEAQDAINKEASSNEEAQSATPFHFFPKQYEDILNWGDKLQISQENAKLRKVDGDLDFISLLQKNVLIGYEYPFFTPYDTVVGQTENVKTNDANVIQIVNLVKSFFKDIHDQRIDANIGKYVIPDEVAIISRQVAFSQEYGPNITEYRLGNLISGQQDTRYANTRVIAQFPNFESRVELLLYFTSVNGSWFISAIEGDINELLIPYTTITRFEPSGTTGVTQGF